MAAVSVAGSLSAIGEEASEKKTALLDQVTLPAWALREIETTAKRLRQWCGNESAVVFPYVTDIHSRNVTLPKEIKDFSDSKLHILFAQRAADVMNADFMADLGDIDLDLSIRVSPPEVWPPKFKPGELEDAKQRLTTHGELYRHWHRPVLFSMGNHDHSHGRISSREYGQFLNVGITQAQGHPLTLSPNGDYGYFDMPGKRTRAIFLNSSDEGYYGYSLAQLRFLIEALSTLPADWTVLSMQHFCIKTSIGHWVSFPNVKAKRQELAIAILEAFAARTKGSAEGLQWDFSTLTTQAFAGFFFGDSHFDHYLKENGIDYTISQGYGGIRDQDMIPGAIKTPFSRKTQLLVDVVAVKPSKREVRVFRIGAGGEKRDRGYTY